MNYNKYLEEIEEKFGSEFSSGTELEQDIKEGFCSEEEIPFNLADAAKVQHHLLIMQEQLNIDKGEMAEILANMANSLSA